MTAVCANDNSFLVCVQTTIRFSCTCVYGFIVYHFYGISAKESSLMVRAEPVLDLLHEALQNVEERHVHDSVPRGAMNAVIGHVYVMSEQWLLAVGYLRCAVAALLGLRPDERIPLFLEILATSVVNLMDTLTTLAADQECYRVRQQTATLVLEWMDTYIAAKPISGISICKYWRFPRPISLLYEPIVSSWRRRNPRVSVYMTVLRLLFFCYVIGTGCSTVTTQLTGCNAIGIFTTRL
jgi:hypothetical protein